MCPNFLRFLWSFLVYVNLSGSRVEASVFFTDFPGSVKLRESTGRAGGFPKGNQEMRNLYGNAPKSINFRRLQDF
jgi:hypothetical protein